MPAVKREAATPAKTTSKKRARYSKNAANDKQSDDLKPDIKKVKIKEEEPVIANIPDTILARLDPYNQAFIVPLEDPESEYLVKRKLVWTNYGGGSQDTFTKTGKAALDKNPGIRVRNFAMLLRTWNPKCPHIPGQPGLFFGCGSLPHWPNASETVFVRITTDAFWRYLGEYEFIKCAPLTVDEFRALPDEAQVSWSSGLAKAEWAAEARTRMFLRIQLGREPTLAECTTAPDPKGHISPQQIQAQLSEGKESIGVWAIRCVAYDEELQLELINLSRGIPRRLPAHAPHRRTAGKKSSQKRRRATDEDSGDEDEDTKRPAQPTARRPVTRSKRLNQSQAVIPNPAMDQDQDVPSPAPSDDPAEPSIERTEAPQSSPQPPDNADEVLPARQQTPELIIIEDSDEEDLPAGDEDIVERHANHQVLHPRQDDQEESAAEDNINIVQDADVRSTMPRTPPVNDQGDSTPEDDTTVFQEDSTDDISHLTRGEESTEESKTQLDIKKNEDSTDVDGDTNMEESAPDWDDSLSDLSDLTDIDNDGDDGSVAEEEVGDSDNEQVGTNRGVGFDDQQEYVVEKILGEEMCADGTLIYHVKWEDYPLDNLPWSWLPAEEAAKVSEVLKEWEDRKAERRRARRRR